MDKHIVTINSGSSSIKFAIFEFSSLQIIYNVVVENLYESPNITIKNTDGKIILAKSIQHKGHHHAILELFKWIENHENELNIAAIGHRIVHGGTNFLSPTIINGTIIKDLKKLIPLAPLHQPHNIEAIEIFKDQYSNILQVACFDTSFHRTQSKLIQSYPLPENYYNEGIIRYGFHGLSYEYINNTLNQHDSELSNKSIIIAHLGNGASMCAIKNKKSHATTMGFTPIDGLMMGTRSGSIDPGIIIHLQEQHKMTIKQVNKLLYEDSGLKGVSNLTNDVEKLITSDKKEAKFAIDMFCMVASRNLSGLIPCIGGLDAIVFTAGIGENSAKIREYICSKLTWLGLSINNKRNSDNCLYINDDDSKVKIMVIPTNEELVIATHTKKLIN